MFPTIQFTGINTGTGLSPGLWKKFPLEHVIADPNMGVWSRIDGRDVGPNAATSGGAVTEANGPLRTFLSQDGAIENVDATSVGSGLKASSNGDDEGVVLSQFLTPFKIAYQGKPFIFEARVKTDTIANSKHNIFVGLLESVVPTVSIPIADNSALADQNLVGFHRLGSDGDYFDTVYTANGVTAVSVQADAAVIVADTWVKLGMYFDGTTLYFYKDGVVLSTSKTIPSGAGTDFPNDVNLGLVFAMRNVTASSPGAAYLDWMIAAQLR